jgi:hypothetical protein
VRRREFHHAVVCDRFRACFGAACSTSAVWRRRVAQAHVASAEALIELMRGGKLTLPSMADTAQAVIRESA